MLSSLPEFLQVVASIFLPVTNTVAVTRSLALGGIEVYVLFNLLWMLIVTPVFFVLAVNLMQRRLTK
ncbi:MAG: hypothetical protein CW691_06835 [Candidatus Bathyarchaeum sp.]|nr:MAG: hypothetical protein CW691_06835 [Candidatus Bathyarchaeum sp.]